MLRAACQKTVAERRSGDLLDNVQVKPPGTGPLRAGCLESTQNEGRRFPENLGAADFFDPRPSARFELTFPSSSIPGIAQARPGLVVRGRVS